MSADEARFYVCLHGPELAESNFALDHAVKFVENEIRGPVSNLRKHYKTFQSQVAEKSVDDEVIELVKYRLEFFSSPEHFSTVGIAKTLLSFVRFLDGQKQYIPRANFFIQYHFLEKMLETFHFSQREESSC